jgi:hypothetical protein
LPSAPTYETTEGVKSRSLRFQVEADPGTFGGKGVPNLLARCGGDAAARFVRFFNERLKDPAERKSYAVAIVRLCDVASETRLELWELTPMFLSIYLEKLHLRGMALEDVRLHWRAIRVLFDWLFGARVITFNAVASVPDPMLGYSWPAPTSDAQADDGTIEVFAVEIGGT